ncbi:MAG: hypothetical protein AB7T49_18940 [Oligoflexales bacterium]
MSKTLFLIAILNFLTSFGCAKKNGSSTKAGTEAASPYCGDFLVVAADGVFDLVPCGNPSPAPPPAKEVYPTKQGAEVWGPPKSGSDPRVQNAEEGSVAFGETGTIRMVKPSSILISTSEPYDRNNVSFDYPTIAKRGYLMGAKDWRNVEITTYIKINTSNSDGRVVFGARSGKKHVGASPIPPHACEVSGYKGAITPQGQTTFIKQQWLQKSFSRDPKVTVKPLLGKWVGAKFIVRNVAEPKASIPHLEIWLDEASTNDWKMIDSYADTNGWGDSGGACGGKWDELITWGGPVVGISTEGTIDVEFKNINVREINI